MLKETVKNVLRKLGYRVSQYDPRRDPEAVRNGLFRSNLINVVLDVGANSGQYGSRLRQLGFSGKIVSFEPLASAFDRLEDQANRDPLWVAEHYALGDYDGGATINIAGNSASSSLLQMLPRHVEEAPHSANIGTENIAVHRLDTVFQRHISKDEHVFLKLDTQGFAGKVLAGAEQCLERIHCLEVELSTVPLYEGEPLIHEVLAYLYDKGFSVYYLEPELFGKSVGQQL
jgi:FkbM family methyltransferase